MKTTQPPAAGADARAMNHIDELRATNEIPHAIEIWFFRDLSDDQRRGLFNICGFSGLHANGVELQRQLLYAVLKRLTHTTPVSEHLAVANAEPGGAGEGLRAATGVVFSAYRASDPLAIRFEFANEEDRLAAANAVDEAGL